MMIIGCDFHTRYQQIAMKEEATAELTAQRNRAGVVTETRVCDKRLRAIAATPQSPSA